MTCHIILMIFLYSKFGLNTMFEGEKYLNEARCFLNGDYAKAFNYQVFYSCYIVYLSIFLYLKTPLLLIFITTYLISLISYCYFYKLLKELISENVAKIWITCMLLSPMLQFWQFNLYSETFFIALSLLFTHTIMRKEIKFRLIKISLLAILLIFSRPSGIFIVGILLATYLWKNKLLNSKTIITTGVILGSILSYLIIFKMPLHYKGFSYDIAGGSIFMGFPTLNTTNLPEGNYTLWDCYQSIIHHYGASKLLSLFFYKWQSFFQTTRPYYTLFHNVVNGLHYVFYAFCLISLYLSYKLRKNWSLFFLALLSIILLNSFMVGLIFNEWSERHTVQVFPFVFAIAAYSIHKSFVKLKSKLNL